MCFSLRDLFILIISPRGLQGMFSKPVGILTSVFEQTDIQDATGPVPADVGRAGTEDRGPWEEAG